MTDETTCLPCLGRRRAIAGALALGAAPLLAACGGDSGAGSGGGAAGPGGAATSEAPAGPLTSTADIPVGGGKIFPAENVVVTQPTEGEFLGFSATCTHQGCVVSKVEDGSILCTCHSSAFSIEDGTPQSGPASGPLAEVAVSVEGDQISIA